MGEFHSGTIDIILGLTSQSPCHNLFPCHYLFCRCLCAEIMFLLVSYFFSLLFIKFV